MFTYIFFFFRYIVVLNLGLEAMRTGDEIDQQRFYQQQSDVCMLRLFDSFGESAPQLVFHLYVLIVKNHWTTDQALWTGVSAITSLVSLGWGIGKYSDPNLGSVFVTLSKWLFFQI